MYILSKEIQMIIVICLIAICAGVGGVLIYRKNKKGAEGVLSWAKRKLGLDKSSR